jgi:hypothetical protein
MVEGWGGPVRGTRAEFPTYYMNRGMKFILGCCRESYSRRDGGLFWDFWVASGNWRVGNDVKREDAWAGRVRDY